MVLNGIGGDSGGLLAMEHLAMFGDIFFGGGDIFDCHNWETLLASSE